MKFLKMKKYLVNDDNYNIIRVIVYEDSRYALEICCIGTDGARTTVEIPVPDLACLIANLNDVLNYSDPSYLKYGQNIE